MNKRKLKYLVAMSIFLTGCFPTQQRGVIEIESEDVNSLNDASSNLNEYPNHISEKVSEKLSIDADIVVSKGNLLEKIPVTMFDFDFDKAATIILGKDHPIEITNDEWWEKSYINADNDSASISFRGINYSSSYMLDKPYSRVVEFDNPNFYIEYPEQELSDLSLDSAKEEVENLMDGIGIEYLENPQVATLTAEQLISLNDNLISVKENQTLTEFNSEDQAYVLSYRLTFNDLLLTNIGYSLGDSGFSLPGSRMNFLINSNGIILINGGGLYTELGEPIQSNLTPISVDQLISIIKAETDNLLNVENITINYIELAYFPMFESVDLEITNSDSIKMTLKPYWIVRYTQDLQEKDGAISDTGEELLFVDDNLYLIYSAKDGRKLQYY
ncbi:hypothetical protein [Fundicoccus culcitae]|uniref:Uncharacterized protein n=1 Tax=Fundicoccus culcitae TaxID=2969821 RepID=A0ABY5P860_9LACT|nr:hypothetical protein [Fundicoccus culcitae]UUX34932.1 hypothetical protein NRE15_04610 [Fundicoccus culcitae]